MRKKERAEKIKSLAAKLEKTANQMIRLEEIGEKKGSWTDKQENLFHEYSGDWDRVIREIQSLTNVL